jgi:hypothetical protein
MSKEMALALPGVLFVCALFKKRRFIEAQIRVIPFALMLGGCLLFRYLLGFGLQNKFERANNFVLLPNFVYETLQAFVPIDFLLLPNGWGQPMYHALPLILLAPMVGIVCLLAWKDRSSLLVLSVFLVLYAVSLVPVLQALRADPSLAKARYLYIPSAFLSTFIAYAIWSVAPIRATRRLIATLAVCGAFLALLLVNNTVWAQASEMAHTVPNHFPFKYKGVPVLLSEAQVCHAHEPPFAPPTDRLPSVNGRKCVARTNH